MRAKLQLGAEIQDIQQHDSIVEGPDSATNDDVKYWNNIDDNYRDRIVWFKRSFIKE